MKIRIYKINENNNKKNKDLNNININIASSEISTNFEEDNKKQYPKGGRKGGRNNSRKKNFNINIPGASESFHTAYIKVLIQPIKVFIHITLLLIQQFILMIKL